MLDGLLRTTLRTLNVYTSRSLRRRAGAGLLALYNALIHDGEVAEKLVERHLEGAGVLGFRPTLWVGRVPSVRILQGHGGRGGVDYARHLRSDWVCRERGRLAFRVDE